MHLIGAKRLAFPVQKVRNALEKYRGFAGARNAIDQKYRYVGVANHRVLLALNGCRDGL